MRDTKQERGRVLGESIVSLLRQAGEDERPGTVALIDDAGRTLTYGDWLERSKKVANAIRPIAPPRAPVILASRNADLFNYAAAYMGVLGVGGVAVPVRLPAPRAEIDRIASVTGATCILATREVDSDLECHQVAPMLAADGGGALTESFAPDDPAQILFSSGTTGLPNAILVPHANLAWGGRVHRPPRPRREVLLHAFPLGTSAFQNQYLRTITHDFSVQVLSVFDARKLIHILRTGEVSTVLFAPAMLNLLADVVSHNETFPAVLSTGTTGSFQKPAHFELLSRIFPQAEIITSYGSTEASPASTSRQFDPQQPLNVGRPNPGCSVKITTEDGKPVPDGESGVVWLTAGGAPMRRYLDERLNARHFDAGWTRMGDLGYLDEDGSLVLVGRATDVISVGGLKVSAPEVEAVLSGHPAVRDVTVFGMPHRILDEQVVAEVVPRADVSERELIQFARKYLAQQKVPGKIVLVDKIERNEMGKVPRRDRHYPGHESRTEQNP